MITCIVLRDILRNENYFVIDSMDYQWFLSACVSLNIEVPIQHRDEIWQLSLINNYPDFIQKITPIMNLNQEQISTFLHYEKFCILCKIRYPTLKDPFMIIINHMNTDITYDLCSTCIDSIKQCKHCNIMFTEPWEKIYITTGGHFITDIRCYKCTFR